MTFARRLRSVASCAGRFAAGTAVGLGLYVALAGPPAFAAEAPIAPAAVPAAAPAEARQGPALWVIRDEDSTIYLYGTVHALRPTTQWASDAVDAAFDSADEIWFEIANPDDQAAAMPLIQQHGLSLDRPLSSRLTAEEFAHLDAIARSVGMNAAQMEPMRPWLASLTLAMAPLLKAGYEPTSGVELVLKARAEASGAPIRGLETLQEQIGILAGMSEEAQLAMLRASMEQFDEAVPYLDGMVALWAAGDVEGLNRVAVVEMRRQSAEMYDAMLTRRNTNWAGQIQAMLEGSGTVFIAVGAAHLAGDDSVQAILAQRGVTVVRQ